MKKTFLPRKLRIDDYTSWDNHRGGWRSALDLLHKHFFSEKGVLFLSAVEDRLYYSGAVEEPWVGVVHQVPHQNYTFPDVSRMLAMDEWALSLPHCQGLFVLCNYTRDFLRSRGVRVPICKIPYPQDTDVPLFSPEKFLAEKQLRILHIGEFLRNYQAFYDLRAPGFAKQIITYPDIEQYMDKIGVQRNASVETVSYLQTGAYDDLLSKSIVFLNLYDAVGVTAVLECVVRATPILVNRVGALPEFLGAEYPWFYENLDHASELLADPASMRAAHRSLCESPLRDELRFDRFPAAVAKTSIYHALPEPDPSPEFAATALSVVVCSYNRVAHLDTLLNALSKQSFGEPYEIVLWNNNASLSAQVDKIAAPYLGNKKVPLRIIHSSRNYYCMIRFAAANLATSPLLLICDDDVHPSAYYLQNFVSAYRDRTRTLGPNFALCARGHRFLPHTLNEDDVTNVWEQGQNIEFLDENQHETRVHFMHADNLLISATLLRRAATFNIPRLEVGLVDDYWLSFVLAHYMKCPLIKLKAENWFSFTPSADDPDVALFHNPAVRRERIWFYIYHMRKGWPAFKTLPDAVENEKKMEPRPAKKRARPSK